VRVIDISQSGCAIATDQRPGIGTAVTIGKTPWSGGPPPRRRLHDICASSTPDFIEDNVTDG